MSKAFFLAPMGCCYDSWLLALSAFVHPRSLHMPYLQRLGVTIHGVGCSLRCDPASVGATIHCAVSDGGMEAARARIRDLCLWKLKQVSRFLSPCKMKILIYLSQGCCEG